MLIVDAGTTTGSSEVIRRYVAKATAVFVPLFAPALTNSSVDKRKYKFDGAVNNSFACASSSIVMKRWPYGIDTEAIDKRTSRLNQNLYYRIHVVIYYYNHYTHQFLTIPHCLLKVAHSRVGIDYILNYGSTVKAHSYRPHFVRSATICLSSVTFVDMTHHIHYSQSTFSR